MTKNTKPKKKSNISNSQGFFNKPIYIYGLIVALVAFILYARSIGFQFVYLDDDLFVIKFQEFNKDILNIFRSFASTLASGTNYYRPLLSVTFIIENNIADLSPWIYHLTNVLLHTICSFLVFHTLIKLKYSVQISFILALFFAVHPMLTPAAVWISGRNDSLVSILLLLSLINLTNYLDNKSNKTKYYILHLLTYCLALFTKEMGIVFPVAAFFYIILFRNESFKIKERIPLLAGWIGVSLFWFLMRLIATTGVTSPDVIGISPVFYNYPTIFAMLGKVFLPISMSPVSYFTAFSIISGVIAFIAIALITLFNKKINWKRIIFGALWFLLFLGPTLAIMLFDHFFDYAEHRVYILMLGILIIVAEIIIGYNVNFNKKAPIVISAILFVLLTTLSFAYTGKIKNRQVFWSHIVKTYPDKPKAYIILGETYQANEKYEQANKLFRKALELKGETLNLYVNLSAVSIKLNNYQDAVYFAQKAITTDSLSGPAWFNLGKSLFKTGNAQYGSMALEKAISLDRNNIDWQIELGNSYFEVSLYDMAIQTFQKLLRFVSDPKKLANIYSNLGSAYGQKGLLKDAEQMFLKSLEYNSKNDITYINLIVYYCKEENNYEKAMYFAKQMEMNGYSIPPDILKILEITKRKQQSI